MYVWFKDNPCDKITIGNVHVILSGRYKKHCFYNPGLKDNCDL